MSRSTQATFAGILFVLAYMVGTVTLYGWFDRLHWALEAVFWLVAGVVWVFPVRWLMLWSVGKR